MKNNTNLHTIIDSLYNISPFIYDLQLNFFNGNHFKLLDKKLENIPHDSILEIGCGTAPILKVFQPKVYTGIDIEEKFIDLAKRIYKKSSYNFMVGNSQAIKSNNRFDIVLFSHTTHHLSDEELKKTLEQLKKIKFKHLVVYDGRPIGIFAPLLLRLDYNAAKFRKAEEFVPLFNKEYTIEHMETFRSNRPFYEYPLLIMKKKKK